jgi:hypothetical protein
MAKSNSDRVAIEKHDPTHKGNDTYKSGNYTLLFVIQIDWSVIGINF